MQDSLLASCNPFRRHIRCRAITEIAQRRPRAGELKVQEEANTSVGKPSHPIPSHEACGRYYPGFAAYLQY